MDTRVIEDADFKSKLKFDLRGFLGTQRPPKGQLEVHEYQVTKVSMVIMEPAD